MGAFNGGGLLILLVLVGFLVFRREIARWCDAQPTEPCGVCGAAVQVRPSRVPGVPRVVLCARCAPLLNGVRDDRV